MFNLVIPLPVCAVVLGTAAWYGWHLAGIAAGVGLVLP